MFAGALLSGAGLAIFAYIPSPFFRWLVGGVSVVLAAGTTVLTVDQDRPPQCVVLGALAALTVVALGLAGGRTLQTGAWRDVSCDQPAAAVALTSPDLAATVSSLARQYEHRKMIAGGCPSLTVHVLVAPRAGARDALVSGWGEEALSEIGARPALWFSDRGTDVWPLTQAPPPGPMPFTSETTRVIAHSRLVLATPGQLSQPADQRSWPETVASLRKGGYRVIRPEPGSSQVGDLALLLDYPRDPQAPASASPADRSRESEYAQVFTKANVRRADLATVLRDGKTAVCPRPGAAPADRLAIAAPEFLVKPSAPGNGTRPALLSAMAGCPVSGAWSSGSRVPSGAQEYLELAVTPLHWADDPGSTEGSSPVPSHPVQTGADDAAADGFMGWLQSPDGKSAVTDMGWEADAAPAPVPPEALAASARAYQMARNSARVLLVVDNSVSMRTVWPGVTRSIDAVLGQLGPGDEVGLSTFVDTAHDEGRPVPRVDLGHVDQPPQAGGPRRRDAVGTALANLGRAGLLDGVTPLGVAAGTAIGQLRGTQAATGSEPAATSERTRATVVILTDGTDVVTAPDWLSLSRQAADAHVNVLVVVLGANGGALSGTSANGPFQGLQVAGADSGEKILLQLAAMLWRSEP